ncbi:MAG: family 43 glycosylhydrolase, partial [Christensenellaceae bacterium]|nr:family 43 glycosylhydrolase [Christensenellaceae bacterium]
MTKRTRSADLGNGTYLNPIMFGHYSDPSVLRDGEDYYMMTGESMLYHSQDLVNWEPMYTLYPQTSKYDVHHPWAPDISKHGDTYYYYAFANTEKHLLFVMTTKDIKNGPWTDPIIMGSAGFTEDGDELIDPALVFDLAGTPDLLMSKNCMYPLTVDGLALAGDLVQVADDPPIPDEYDIEGVYTEGP